ncbi:MAG: hypothetical protein HY644_15740 [Acidobacteria bacterium]|nr:hypothetical protein [Acidobacteriota bacterium]
MMLVTPGKELAESLRSLQAIARELQREIGEPLPEPNLRMARLRVAVASLGQAKPTKSLRCPEEYVKQWNKCLEDKDHLLEARAVRYLCWEPEIATGHRFQYYLDHHQVTLNARSLQGLVRSCHSRWSTQFAKSQVAIRVCSRLETYEGANRLLSRWKVGSSVIMGPKGAQELGAKMVKGMSVIKQHCESWGVADETCAYVQAAVRHAAEVCRDGVERVPEIRQYLLKELLPWSGWPPDVFKSEVGQLILHPATIQATDVKEAVRRFALSDTRLGDPRLPRNRLNWAGIGEAERRIIEWLSQLDIVFFFETVLSQGRDPHGRKAFWLRYLSSVIRSRPLLTWEDRSRLQAILKQKGQELANFGLMDGSTSGFLLDLGPLLAVEFSAVGNACYLYRKDDIEKIIPDFWTPDSFYLTVLKQPRLCLQRIVHRNAWPGAWQEEASQILAQFGIRPRDRQ